LNTEAPIGIFDSGIGGLTVAHAINKTLPNEKIVYFGDTIHLPYGNKSNNEIKYYSNQISNFLLKRKCKIIVIACNSASAVAFEELKKKMKKKCLIVNVIDPVIYHVTNNLAIKNIGVIGTTATISSEIYPKLIQKQRKDINIYTLATPQLASLIEENNYQLKIKSTLESYLKDQKLTAIDSLILGCTHYPLIENQINIFYKQRVLLISSIQYIGEEVKKLLGEKKLLNTSKNKMKHHFYVSNYSLNFQRKTELFFSSSINLEEENIFS
tara:strand:- start:1428 stop:2234 length:807 start_codon:yes stop_codon:yes gene_type:complete